MQVHALYQPHTARKHSLDACSMLIVIQSESSDDEEEQAAPVAAASSRSAKSKRKLSDASTESADNANGELGQYNTSVKSILFVMHSVTAITVEMRQPSTAVHC
jgi:hypothetical protein